ncbi:GAF domain-containing protein, partial [Nostoc sp. NIES-2111]
MASAPLPFDEPERLRTLQELEVLDSDPEAEFDALAAAAALVCNVPLSLVSLVDHDRQWFKANVGLPGVTQTPRELAFCAHAIVQDDVLEVPDALADERFADNPLVVGAPEIRFYAGAPLRMADGTHAGTLCVIDRVPRQLTA